MIVTILAIACILLLGSLTMFGYRAIIRRSGPSTGAVEREKCAVCREPAPKAELVVRQIGDYKVLYFCRPCIARLAAEAGIGS